MPSPEPHRQVGRRGTVRANPIGVRPTPSSPQTDDAKKDPNADGADKADCPHGRDPGETATSRR